MVKKRPVDWCVLVVASGVTAVAAFVKFLDLVEKLGGVLYAMVAPRTA